MANLRADRLERAGNKLDAIVTNAAMRTASATECHEARTDWRNAVTNDSRGSGGIEIVEADRPD